MESYRGRTIVVTGASTGLGAEFAVRFAERGADLVLVARREERLRGLADELGGRFGIAATPLALDLAAPDAAGRLRAGIRERGLRVDGLVNNAGFGTKGPFAEADPARAVEMVRLNAEAVVALSREFLPDLQRAGSGILVNVASTAAYQPCPGMAVYGATKAFVLSFTEALARETHGTGVRVLALNPGPTGTEFFEVAGGAPSGFRYQTPERVVASALRALDRRRTPPSTTVGLGNRVASKLVGILPRRLVLDVSARLLGGL
jgi:uncharacterized protein